MGLEKIVVKIKKKSGQCRLCFEKIQKLPLLFHGERLIELFGKHYHCRTIKWMVSHRLVQKISISKLPVKTQLTNLHFAF